MKKGLTEIVCIIDRSGSMGSIVNDAIGGFNSFLEEQKKLPGEANLTCVLFNHKYNVIHENEPIKDVPVLDTNTYVPSGMTALLDAVGHAIDTVGKRLSNTTEEAKPEKVVVAILTDGEENSSKKYDLSKIKEMIEHQKSKYKWEFIFLGANQDAFAEAAKIGVDATDTIHFAATSKGIKDAYTRIGSTVTSYRA